MPSLSVRRTLAEQLGLRKKQIYKWFWEIIHKDSDQAESDAAATEADLALDSRLNQMTQNEKFLFFMSQIYANSEASQPQNVLDETPSLPANEEDLVEHFRKHYKFEGFDFSNGCQLSHDQTHSQVRQFFSSKNPNQGEIDDVTRVLELDIEKAA